MDLTEIRALFAAHGVGAVGVAAALPLPQDEARYRARMAAGYAAGMDYLHQHADLKFRPDRILPGCRSIVVAALGYRQEVTPGGGPGREPAGKVARYAWGQDYHEVLGGKLKAIAREMGRRLPAERFLAATDSTPLAEVKYAERAGLGTVGRNGLLIHPHLGSWIVLGEILTTADLTPTPPAAGLPQCPPGCRRCLDACPTGAIVAPGVLDARLCISYHTIENRAVVPEELRGQLGDHLFGCDDCQEVCPLNARAPTTTVPEFLRHRAGPEVPLSLLLALRSRSEVERRFRGSALTRSGRSGLVRSAAVVAANQLAGEEVRALRALQGDRDPRVAEHASWAVQRLTSGDAKRESKDPGDRPAGATPAGDH